MRDIRKKQVTQVEEALAELSLEREHVEMQMQHLNTQLQQLMNPQEEAQQKSLIGGAGDVGRRRRASTWSPR